MDRPAFPALVALIHVHGRQPQAIPLKGLPDWYALAIPAGHPAYLIAPDGNMSADCTPAQLEVLLDEAARRGVTGLAYGRWTVRVTRGAWTHLAAVKDVLIDILNMSGILPMEPGVSTVADRARLFARTCIRRLMAPPSETGTPSEMPTPRPIVTAANGEAGTRPASRPSLPLSPAAPSGNGELRTASVPEDAPQDES